MVADRYPSFAELRTAEREHVDYRIVAVDRGSTVTIIAPHGGRIEPPTSAVATLLAAETFNLYCFEGLQKDREHHELHITSHNFDEPQCCKLVGVSDIVVAFHGQLDRDRPNCVDIGGLDRILRDRMAYELGRDGFEARTEGHLFPATGAENICNRGRRGQGVQLELPRSLRDLLRTNPEIMAGFVEALRRAIAAHV
jgi:phage replication-related protein YjqB (UPF0714/DUF867 family)